jgi:hypothetical protein
MKLLQRLDAKNDELDAILGALTPEEISTLNILLDKIRKPD